MHTTKLTLLRGILALTDFLLLNICLFAAYTFSSKHGLYIDSRELYTCIAAIWASWFLSTGLFRLYSEYTIYKFNDINKLTWRTVALHSILFSIYLFAIHVVLPFIIVYSVIVTLGFMGSRAVCYVLLPLLKLDFEKRQANILAIASVGGHWIELLRIMPLFKGKNVTFISNKETLKDTVKGHSFYTVPDANKDSKLNLIRCVVKVCGYILFLRPQVIISTGAAPGLLGIFIGKILGIKTIWIDSIANVEKLSLSGTIAMWLADRVYTQWEHLATKPDKLVFSGNLL